MKKRFSTKLAATVVAALLATSFGAVGVVSLGSADADAATMTHASANTRSRAAIAFRNKMRKLWEDHIVWTRNFIVSAVAGLPDNDVAAGRLLANQDHIGNAIKTFYGDAAGDALTGLLRDHILIAAELVGAAKEGDSAKVEDASARWYENSNDIADFLNAANKSNWPRSEMRSMMKEHLDATLAEAVARLNGDWDADIQAYNKIHRDILHMADMLSLGIIAQFPGRF